MRWIVRAFGLLLLAVVLVAGVFLLLPGDKIAKVAASQLSSWTGREVTMSGETTLSFYPILGVSTGAVTVANAEWSDGEPMFRAESLKIGVEPQVLWGGDIRITGLEAVGPVINLEKAADGRVNWELNVEGVAPSGQAAEGAAPEQPESMARSDRLALTLDRALVEDATFLYTDHGTGERTEMRGMAFDFRWPEYEGRATFDMTLRPAGEAVRIEGYLDRVGEFIDGAVSDVKATVRTQGGEATFLGRASPAPEVQGRVTAAVDDTGAFMAALGLPKADIPAGLGRSVNGETLVTYSADQRLSLREVALQLDGNRIGGAADVDLGGERPVVSAQINAGALDLTGMKAEESGGQVSAGRAPAAADTGWSTEPIDASALGLANAEVALTAESVDMGDLKVGTVRAMMTLDRSRLVFDLREVRAYNALITGNFVVNNRSGLSVGGDLNAAGIDMESFLTDAAGVTRFSGEADASLSFLGVGNTEQAIMNSLSGEGAVQTGRGVIKGFDLDKLMRSGVATGGTTIFDTMGATFTMENGVARNDDLLLQLPLAKAEGEGMIALGQRRIDYLFTPVLLEGESTKGLAIPVRIRGPWDDPEIKPDLEAAIDRNFADEKKELEDKAEEEVRRAVEKELGVKVDEGESVEDALKRTLEEEAKKGLLKLFD
ncbi:membrane assembly protein AsmA [Roseovarius sp. HI0049]|nr:membrane assembly protein AsmA [Roseovarius sp. HI0049]